MCGETVQEGRVQPDIVCVWAGLQGRPVSTDTTHAARRQAGGNLETARLCRLHTQTSQSLRTFHSHSLTKLFAQVWLFRYVIFMFVANIFFFLYDRTKLV